MKAQKADQCAKVDGDVGETIYEIDLYGTKIPLTATQMALHDHGDQLMHFLFPYIHEIGTPHVTKDSCIEEDCLHPCYGPSHWINYCNVCYSYLQNLMAHPRLNSLSDFRSRPPKMESYCPPCQVPNSLEEVEYPGEFQPYVPLDLGEVPATVSFEQFKEITEKLGQCAANAELDCSAERALLGMD